MPVHVEAAHRARVLHSGLAVLEVEDRVVGIHRRVVEAQVGVVRVPQHVRARNEDLGPHQETVAKDDHLED